MLSAIDLFIPKVRQRRNQRSKCMSFELKHQQNCLQSQRKCKKHHSVSNQEKLCNFVVAMQTQLLEAKSYYEDYLMNELSSGNTLNIYKYINYIGGNHVIPATLFKDSNAVTSNLDKSNISNLFFYSGFTHFNTGLPATNTLSTKSPTLSFITIMEEDVYLTLCSLDSSKDTGPDFGIAFDNVPHNELLVKLWSIGFTDCLWFKGYLTSRFQIGSLHHCHSNLLPVASRVPQ